MEKFGIIILAQGIGSGIRIVPWMIFGCLFLFLLFHMTYFFWGLFPDMRARNLTENEIAAIKSSGLVHGTKDTNVENILRSKVFTGHGGWNSYSNHFRKTSFFYIMDFREDSRCSLSYSFSVSSFIRIRNITDEQIQHMKIRSYDKAVMVCGDFHICNENVIDVFKEEYNCVGKFKKFVYAFTHNPKIVIYIAISVFVSLFLLILVGYLIFVF